MLLGSIQGSTHSTNIFATFRFSLTPCHVDDSHAMIADQLAIEVRRVITVHKHYKPL